LIQSLAIFVLVVKSSDFWHVSAATITLNMHNSDLSKMLNYCVNLLVIIFVAAVSYSCGKPPRYYGAEPVLHGSPITPSEALTPRYFQRQIKLQGTIRAFCRTEGCWIAVSDGKQTLGVMFRDPQVHAPPDCIGKTAVLEGEVTDRIFTAEDARKFDLEAGEHHEFCLLGEQNCGRKQGHSTGKIAAPAGDSRVTVFSAVSLVISEQQSSAQ
jgi:hypothetical protein